MTLPARRILVPDDFTAASSHTWAWARRFAAPGARLASLYVYDAPPAPVMGLPAPPLTGRAENALLERMREERPDASSWRVAEGDAVTRILRASRRADLVVLGTHGRTGLARAAFGSVAEAVMHEAAVPVLAVRGAPGKTATVLAPVTLESYAYRGLLLAAEAAAFLGAELVLLHLTPPGKREGNPRFFIDSLVARLPPALREKTRPRLLLRGGEPIAGILAEARRHGLVVLTAHRKSLLGDLVLGTTVERVVRHSPTAVLAAPSSGR
ncbi:MAG: universal stress protein [Elusimicrobia bacterium]|nr:universal stress protein [Elusimicrobiota bacterium]